MTWTPPWSVGPLGALGAAPLADLKIADIVAAHIRAQRAAGRPFYENVPPAFTQRFQQVARKLYGYIRWSKTFILHALSDEEKDKFALRVINKTYFNAVRGMQGYRGQASLSTWFHAIARNAAIDELRLFFRTPAGRRLRAEGGGPAGDGVIEYFDASSEAGQRKLLKAEVAIATANAADATAAEWLDDRLRAVTSRLARIADLKDPKTGLPYLDAQTQRVLFAIVHAHGDLANVARALGVDASTAARQMETAIATLTAKDALVERLSKGL